MRPMWPLRLLSSARHTFLACLALSCVRCADGGEADRAAWLSKSLIEDHWHLLQRSPSQVEGKFAKMRGEYLDGSSSLYPYLRGSLPQMYRDLTGDYPALTPSSFVSEEGARVLLIGDPHLENLSSQVDDQGGLYLDWDDFDSAGYGPWIWDLRRLALSWWVLSYELDQEPLASALIDALVVGYVQEVQGLSSLTAHESSAPPVIVQRFFQGVRARWYEGRLFQRYLTQEEGRVSLKRGEVRAPEQAGVIKDSLQEVQGHTLGLMERAVSQLRADRPSLGALKDLAQKYGQGVSSYPLMRYYLLFEGPSEVASDDELWELKELSNAPRALGTNLLPLRAFSDLGGRVLGARHALQSGRSSAADGPLPCVLVQLGDLSFQARRRSDLLRAVGFDELLGPYRSAEEEATRQERFMELKALAHLTGALLAGAHGRAETYTGLKGREVIAQDVSQAPLSALIQETLSFAVHYGSRLARDRALLLQIIDERGPLLGYIRSAP